jgi:hypothetical protein
MKHDPLHPSSEDLFAYRDGEMVPEKRAIVEAHVMGCSVCRSFIDQISSLEAEVRQSPDRAPAGYLEGLHESVRARIATAASGAEAGKERRARGAADDRVIGGGAEPWKARERGSEEESAARERGRVKEAPSLPWAAVISTVSAAVAVMVVVVILIKQGPYQRMITPRPKTAETHPPAGGAPTKQESAGGVSVEPERSRAADLEAKAGAGGKKDQGAAGSETPPEELQGAPAVTDEAFRDRLAKRADEVTQKTEPAPAQIGEVAREEANRAAAPDSHFETLRALSAAPGAPGAPSDEAPPSPRYAAILTRYGLPPVWDRDHVSSEALANAEPELRSLYVSGSAGSDSGRVRLYLAEAARLRYAPGDSVLYDEIQRHYRRAITLGGPSSRIARLAEERLRTLER